MRFSPQHKNKRGFALLISVIVAGIILSVSISVVNNALKEVILASTARQSLVSFYFADSAAECFLYWDNIRGNPAIESVFTHSGQAPFECAGWTLTTDNDILDGHDLFFFWYMQSPSTEESQKDPCTYVVKRLPNIAGATTTIRSWGFNTCDNNNSRRVDRALEIEY